MDGKHCTADVAVGSWRLHLEDSDTLYDTIIALDVLEHLSKEELLPTLKVSRARLAPGGRLIIRAPNALCPWALPILYDDLTHQFLFTPHTLRFLLRSAGFAGQIVIKETRPAGAFKRIIFGLIHNFIVKPMYMLSYYHFHGEFPSHLTPNINVCRVCK